MNHLYVVWVQHHLHFEFAAFLLGWLVYGQELKNVHLKSCLQNDFNKIEPLWLGFPRASTKSSEIPARGYPIYNKSAKQIKINPFDRERKPRESPQLINKKWFFVINNDVQVVPDLSDNSSIRIRSIDKNARLITFFRTSKSYLSSWIP